jgi:hypothetical protein
MWDVEIDGLRVEVRTGKEEISFVRGTVTYRPGEVRGESCIEGVPVSPDEHGVHGRKILDCVRTSVPGAKVTMSPHGLVIWCTGEEQVETALVTINVLDPVKLVDVAWQGNRMMRVYASPDTPLTTVGRKIMFDGGKDSVPIQVHYSEARRKLQDDDLTRLGRKVLADIIEHAQRLGVALVELSHTYLEVCFRVPCDECNREQLGRELVAAIA